MPKKTVSEILFEEILNGKNILFEKIQESNTSDALTPDYLIMIDSINSYWEVKELKDNEDENNILEDSENNLCYLYQIHSERVRGKIKDACEQFKKHAVTDFPCIIVLHDARSFGVDDIFFDLYVKEAMLGKGEFQELRNGSVIEISRKDALLTRKNKNYISAVVIIYSSTKEAIFLHNPNAKFDLMKTSIKNRFNNHFIAEFTNAGLVWNKV